MVELLTMGGIAAVVIVVLAACFAIYKALTRETTFEEAFPNAAVKLLTSKEGGADKNKMKGKRHHPRRKTSLIKSDSHTNQQEEASKDDLAEPKTAEQEPNPKPTEPKETSPKPKEPKASGDGKKKPDGAGNKSKKPKPTAPAPQLEEVQVEELEIQQKTVEPLNAMVNENGISNAQQNGEDNGIADTNMDGAAAAMVNHMDPVAPIEKNASPVRQQPKKSRKTVIAKEMSVAKVIERLKEVGEIEPEYLAYLHGITDDTKSKENKLRDEIKDVKTEKSGMEKKLKQSAEELDQLRTQKDQLMRDKQEQQERHVVFEQTVRNKLVETVQLKEENKKLAECVGQQQSKLAKMEQFHQQNMAQLQTEVMKAQQERELTKNYAEKLVNDMRKVQEEVRNAQGNFERQSQAELQKERTQRSKLEQECGLAKQMMEKLVADVAAKDNALRETDQIKAAYEAKLQAVQNELNREKMAWKNAEFTAEKQLTDISRDAEKVMAAYQNLKAQQEAESAKLQETATMNTKLETEIGRLREQVSASAQNSSAEVEAFKSSIADLNSRLEDQRQRNVDLREANFKLHDTVKQLQSTAMPPKLLINGTAPHNTAAAANGDNNNTIDGSTNQKEDDGQIERLRAENNQYKQTLDSLNNQLEEVSQIAREMEREKDAKIAQIEEKLTRLLEAEG